uniref:Putative trypsin-like serine protease n=1 Tax=Corethrella appendiculata TaxID=1370023 RepID=U5ESE3_9DIPT
MLFNQFRNLILILIIILLKKCNFNNAQDVGDLCIVQRTGGPGICKLVSNCASVIDDIRNRRNPPTKCGFQDKVQIVCCPDDVVLSTTTSKTIGELPPDPIMDRMKTNGTKISEKCMEYGEAVYIKEYVTSLGLSDSTRVQKVDKCGHTAVELIVDGVAAKSREFPHMAIIGFGDEPKIEYLCGGSLVSDRFIITAGHCLYSEELGDAKVARLGELSLNSTEDEAFPEDFKVIETIPHPEYKASVRYNDIALLKLDRKVIFSPYIRPICLPQQAEIRQKRAIATGWGKIGYSEASSEILLKVTLDLFTHDECTTHFTPNRRLADGIIETSQLCAGSRDSSKDTCQGDSGGPLQVYNEEVYCTYTIIGITSFGKYCGLAGTPGVYTKVYPYIPWIQNIIWS